jgi:hypothetical protein
MARYGYFKDAVLLTAYSEDAAYENGRGLYYCSIVGDQIGDYPLEVCMDADMLGRCSDEANSGGGIKAAEDACDGGTRYPGADSASLGKRGPLLDGLADGCAQALGGGGRGETKLGGYVDLYGIGGDCALRNDIGRLDALTSTYQNIAGDGEAPLAPEEDVVGYGRLWEGVVGH